VGWDGGLFEDLVVRVDGMDLVSVFEGASDFGLSFIGE